MRLVRRIGKVLGLQTKRAVLMVRHTADAFQFSVQEIAGVKLHAGLGGEHFDAPAGGRLAYPANRFQLAASPLQDEVMIVSARRVRQLIETGADLRELLKIKRSSRD